MNKIIKLSGSSNYNYPMYLLHTPTNTLALVENASCTAEAERIFAEHLNLEYDGIFISDTKRLNPDFKSHKKILDKFIN